MKLKIYAGRVFTSTFTVVSDDGVTGVVLDPADTATFSIDSAGPSPVCMLAPVAMTIVDADNGMFEVSLTAEQTSELTQELGGQEDGYSPLNTYTAFLDFTLVSGNRQAKCALYVVETAVCPVV